MRRTIALFVLLALAGCMSPGERADRDLKRFGPYCEKLGHKPGTTSHAACVQNEANAP